MGVDHSQSKDLAAAMPDKLKELQALFDKEAIRNNVYPIDDRRVERFNPAIAGRPSLMGARKEITVYDGMVGIMENTFLTVNGKHHVITANIETTDANDKGVIIAQAGTFGGWVVYIKDGKVHHEYNWFGLERSNVASTQALKPGKHVIKYEFIPNSAKPATGGKSILTVDGGEPVEIAVPKTVPFMFSADEGLDVGVDTETPVSEDYKVIDSNFTGKITSVHVALK